MMMILMMITIMNDGNGEKLRVVGREDRGTDVASPTLLQLESERQTLPSVTMQESRSDGGDGENGPALDLSKRARP